LQELFPATTNNRSTPVGNGSFEGEQYFDNGQGMNGFFPRGNFEGASGGPVGPINNSSNDDEEEEVLPLPTIDWTQKAN
jgi:hypothetical protein